MRRVRLLIYEGTEEWVSRTMANELVSPYICEFGTITSIDLNPHAPDSYEYDETPPSTEPKVN